MYWKVERKRSLLFLASVWIGWPWCVEKRKRCVCVCLIQCMASVDWSSHFAWLDSCKEAFAPSTMKYQEVFKQMSSHAPFAKSGGRRCKIPPNSDSWSPRPQTAEHVRTALITCSMQWSRPLLPLWAALDLQQDLCPCVTRVFLFDPSPAVGDTWSQNLQCTTFMSKIRTSFLSLSICSSSMIPCFVSACGQLGSRHGMIYAPSSRLLVFFTLLKVSSLAFEELQAFEESLQLSWKGLPSMQAGLGKLVCRIHRGEFLRIPAGHFQVLAWV